MQAYLAEQSSIRFGEFELELGSGELRKDGSLVKLQPQPLKVLALLAANAGRLVTREEIQRAVWDGETFVDFEHGLNFCIKQIRTALGDNAQAPLYIETLPRRGYRFIAPVEKAEQSEDENHSAEASPQVANLEAAPERKVINWRTPALVLIPLIIIGAYFVWQRFSASPVPAKAKVMLAVMPFENLSSDPEQDYFSDGMTEEMIAQLGSLQPARLGVIARTSAMTYKRGAKDIRQIAEELNVDYVLEGSVRREGDLVRITAQLIQTSDQTHLWSESYERNGQNALAVQSDVARNIARALALELLPTERTETNAGAISTEAHDAYLKGRYLWNKGRADYIENSVSQYEQALEIAPDYALAHAGLSDSYIMLGMYYRLSPAEAYRKAKAAAARALELDDTLAEAHTSLGTIRFRFDWDWPEAEREFKRALELNPSYSRAHHDYAWFLVAMERFDEAIAEINRAQELDPLSPLANSDVGWVYLRARRYDDAIKQIQRTLELEPGFGSAQACLERAYRMKGMYKEALDLARKEMIRRGAGNEELAALDRTDVIAGLRNVERLRLKERAETAKSRTISPYSVAALYAELDEKDAAFVWLERAFRERDSDMASLKVDPAFDSLHSDARFFNLLRRIGFADQASGK